LDVDGRILTSLLVCYSEPIPPSNYVPSQAGTRLKLLDIGGHGYNITARLGKEAAVDWQEPVVLRRYAAYPLPALTDNWTRGCSQQAHHRPNQPHQAFIP